MDEIDFMLSNRQPTDDMTRRMMLESRREYDQVRQAERDAAAKHHRDELLFDAMRMVGVQPGDHFNLAQAVEEAEAVRGEKQRELEWAERGVLNKRRDLADLRAKMTEAERIRDRMLETEDLVVPVSAQVAGRPKGPGVARSAAERRAREPLASCRECRAAVPGITEAESSRICHHSRAQRSGSGTGWPQQRELVR